MGFVLSLKNYRLPLVLFLWLGFLISCSPSNPNMTVNTKPCLHKLPPVISIPAAQFQMGSNQAYPEEAPTHMVEVGAFNIDASEVTNSQFRAFVTATNYVTTAEQKQAGFERAGAAVFSLPTPAQKSWWTFVEGANWKHPEGPKSSIENRNFDPVVQVSHADASAYAKWAGRKLPSEAQWEFAAKANANTVFVWGDKRTVDGQEMANTWQGVFPVQNSAKDGYPLRAPVGCFAPNDFGLYDMIGNVWEWTDSIYEQTTDEPVYTIKGGSFLCAPNYCRRYRPTARQPHEAGFSTNHIGFRTIGN